jgi:hypothetical protein
MLETQPNHCLAPLALQNEAQTRQPTPWANQVADEVSLAFSVPALMVTAQVPTRGPHP